MSYQVGSACYATAQAAAQVSASAQVGVIVQHGASAYVIDAASVSGASITYAFTPVGGGTALTVVAPYTAQPCNLLGAEDALQFGWGIVAAWLAVFAVMFIARALRGETEGSYGNA